MALYNLVFTDNELGERFNVGYFSTRGAAEETARYYLRNVRGFCEYDCSYSINEKSVLGSPRGEVFIAFGWNGYEENIVESECCATESLARRRLAELHSEFSRSDWCVDRYRVDERKWTDGFVRV